MPTISALDPGLRYDDADQEAARMRAGNQDFMFRSYLQNQSQANDNGSRERMLAAELADRNAGRQFEGGLARDLQGTFDQKSQAQRGIAELNNTGLNDRTRMTVGPQQTMADLEAKKYNDQAGVGNAVNGLRLQMINDMQKRMGGAAGGAAPGGVDPFSGEGSAGAPGAASGGFSFGPGDQRAAMFGLLGIKDPNAQTDDLVRQALMARVPGADSADLPGILNAVRTGNPKDLPPAQGLNTQAMGGYAQAQQAVAPDIQDMHDFLRKHNWNINDATSATVAQKFQAISQKLDSFRVPQAIKSNILNDLKQKMQQALSENGVMFEASGSDALRQQYGL